METQDNEDKLSLRRRLGLDSSDQPDIKLRRLSEGEEGATQDPLGDVKEEGIDSEEYSDERGGDQEVQRVAATREEDPLHPESHFTCPLTGEVLPTSDWDRHLGSHAVIMRIDPSRRCVFCSQKFSKWCKKEKDDHVLRHFLLAVKATHCRGQLTGLECPLCKATSKNYDFFKTHIFRKHFGDEDAEATCEICNIDYQHTFDLLCHLFESHITSLPWCSYLGCNFGEGHPRLLEKHLVEDHGYDPMCPFCGKRAKLLKTHLLKHGLALQQDTSPKGKAKLKKEEK